MTPAEARAAPTKTPAITLGSRISKIMVSWLVGHVVSKLAKEILLRVILTMFESETFTGPNAQDMMTQASSSITSMVRTDMMRFLLLNLVPVS